MRQRGLGANEPLPDYDDGRLAIRPADYVATADGAILPLKLRELGLLAALANSAGRVVTRGELLERVWESGDGGITPRAVDACVARLRAALGAALPELSYIHTHARIGYRFGRQPAEPGQAEPRTLADSAAGGGAPASVGETPSPERAVPPASTEAPGETSTASNL
jgi:DNA-binding winged helix-turn-helix (wHTH) protein